MACKVCASGAVFISACRALLLKRQNVDDGTWNPDFSKLHTFSEIGNHRMGTDCFFFTLVLVPCSIFSKFFSKVSSRYPGTAVDPSCSVGKTSRPT